MVAVRCVLWWFMVVEGDLVGVLWWVGEFGAGGGSERRGGRCCGVGESDGGVA
jgi:hypothetical protein